jgi:hypothetical protein
VTTKVNSIVRKPQIIIDVNPDGTSLMRVHGQLNMVAVSLVLSAQLNTLLPKLFEQAMKAASHLTDGNGQPILQVPRTVPDSMHVVETESESNDKEEDEVLN